MTEADEVWKGSPIPTAHRGPRTGALCCLLFAVCWRCQRAKEYGRWHNVGNNGIAEQLELNKETKRKLTIVVGLVLGKCL